MLKILKYDFLEGWNRVKGLLAAAGIVSILLGVIVGLLGRPAVWDGAFAVVGEEETGIAVGILSIVWFALMVALAVLTVCAIFQNLSHGMFHAEGIFVHTLPVETWELLTGKALGTWLFGVFMVTMAMAAILLTFFACIGSLFLTAGVSGKELFESAVIFTSRLTPEHWSFVFKGAEWTLYGAAVFGIMSLILVVQLQFVCIAAHQYRHAAAGGLVVFLVLSMVESKVNRAIPYGVIGSLLVAAACAYGSWWLLKHRLRVG